MSKQALVSNDMDELPGVSTPEQINNSTQFEPPNNVLTYTTGPLAVALMNYHHQTQSNNQLISNLSSTNIGSSINERGETEHDSMFTAPTSLNKESVYPTSDSPNDAPPIFRNVLHVAIMYGKYITISIIDSKRKIIFHINKSFRE